MKQIKVMVFALILICRFITSLVAEDVIGIRTSTETSVLAVKLKAQSLILKTPYQDPISALNKLGTSGQDSFSLTEYQGGEWTIEWDEEGYSFSQYCSNPLDGFHTLAIKDPGGRLWYRQQRYSGAIGASSIIDCYSDSTTGLMYYYDEISQKWIVVAQKGTPKFGDFEKAVQSAERLALKYAEMDKAQSPFDREQDLYHFLPPTDRFLLDERTKGASEEKKASFWKYVLVGWLVSTQSLVAPLDTILNRSLLPKVDYSTVNYQQGADLSVGWIAAISTPAISATLTCLINQRREMLSFPLRVGLAIGALSTITQAAEVNPSANEESVTSIPPMGPVFNITNFGESFLNPQAVDTVSRLFFTFKGSLLGIPDDQVWAKILEYDGKSVGPPWMLGALPQENNLGIQSWNKVDLIRDCDGDALATWTKERFGHPILQSCSFGHFAPPICSNQPINESLSTVSSVALPNGRSLVFWSDADPLTFQNSFGVKGCIIRQPKDSSFRENCKSFDVTHLPQQRLAKDVRAIPFKGGAAVWWYGVWHNSTTEANGGNIVYNPDCNNGMCVYLSFVDSCARVSLPVKICDSADDSANSKHFELPVYDVTSLDENRLMVVCREKYQYTIKIINNLSQNVGELSFLGDPDINKFTLLPMGRNGVMFLYYIPRINHQPSRIMGRQLWVDRDRISLESDFMIQSPEDTYGATFSRVQGGILAAWSDYRQNYTLLDKRYYPLQNRGRMIYERPPFSYDAQGRVCEATIFDCPKPSPTNSSSSPTHVSSGPVINKIIDYVI